VSSCAAKGWASRSCSVTLWYSFKAAFNIAVKLSVKGQMDGFLPDIVDRKWIGGGRTSMNDERRSEAFNHSFDKL
jgi:hypothetical protein